MAFSPPPGPPPMPQPQPQPSLPACYRHPDRVGGVRCQRCDRPICPQCMHQASVGFHCPECAKKGAQTVYQGPAAMRRPPLLTLVLIAVNVAVFLWGVVTTGSEALLGASDLMFDYGLIAQVQTASFGVVPVGVGDGEWYRLVTSGFLHYGLIHLALNMYALYLLGGILERDLGRARFLTIYGVSLLTGSLGALLLDPGALTAGASGAIFGLMGAMLAEHRSRGIPFTASPIFGMLLLNLLLTFGIANISKGGHLGGLAGGFLAGMILLQLPASVTGRARRPGAKLDQGDLVALGLCLVVGAGALVVSLVRYG